MTEISIEIFKTNIQNQKTSKTVMDFLRNTFPHLSINIDLNDCDKILRVEGKCVPTQRIIEELFQLGFQCEWME